MTVESQDPWLRHRNAKQEPGSGVDNRRHENSVLHSARQRTDRSRESGQDPGRIKDSSVQGYRNLTTYGILPEYSIKSIVEIIDFLIGEGYIDPGDGFRPTIRVTDKGRQLLRERTPIIIPGA